MREEHEYKKSDLTVSLGGAAVNAARTVAAPVKRAGEVGDGRLKALYALQAGMNARNIQKNRKTDKSVNKNNAEGERLDKQASRYSAEHLRRLWWDPIEDDRRERTHRRLYLPGGNKVEFRGEGYR